MGYCHLDINKYRLGYQRLFSLHYTKRIEKGLVFLYLCQTMQILLKDGNKEYCLRDEKIVLLCVNSMNFRLCILC